jgi:OOP family OmpA-OmpF porin
MFKLLLSLMIITSLHANVENEFDFLVGRNLILGSSSFNDAADSGFGLNANFRHYMSDQWSLGLGYHYLDFTDVQTKDHALYLISSYETTYEGFIPYATAGIGVAKVSGEPSYSKIAIHGAIGARKHYKDNIRFNAALNFHHIPENDDFNNAQTVISPMVGITFFFDNGPVVTEVVEKVTLSDLDEDGDGVIDSEDQCPGTIIGVEVNYLGCEKDTDVNITLNVKFELESDRLDSRYLIDLDRLAKVMTKNSDLNIEVQGHSDNTGSEEFNKNLSQKRADSVTSYLVKEHGVSRSRIKSKGYGPLIPIATNETLEGRSKNRRVEAKLMIR